MQYSCRWHNEFYFCISYLSQYFRRVFLTLLSFLLDLVPCTNIYSAFSFIDRHFLNQLLLCFFDLRWLLLSSAFFLMALVYGNCILCCAESTDFSMYTDLLGD